MRLLLLKLGALCSFLGGPLYCMDAWTPHLGSALAFGLGFSPIILMMFGALALPDERSRWSTWAIVGGLVGTAALLVMDLAVALLLVASPAHPERGLHAFGIVVGVIVSGLYARAARRWLRGSATPDAPNGDAPSGERFWSPGPTFDDWGLLVLGVVFVLAGLVILPSNPEVGLVTLTFFGLCTAVFVHTLRRKLRWARGEIGRVPLVGQRRYPLRRRPVLLLGVALVGLGCVGVVFGTAYPWLFRFLVGSVGVLGVVILLLLALGYPRGHLRFDPDALEIGHARHRVRLPWNALHLAVPGEMFGHPILQLVLLDPEAVEVEPAHRRAAVLAAMRRNERLVGCHETVMTQRYGLELPSLHAWLEDLICNPSARDQLRDDG